MPAYQQLQESYRRYEQDRRDYYDKVVNAVSQALMALRQHIGAPEGKSRFAPIKRERTEGMQYSTVGAVTHDEDGWWSGCLLVDVAPDGLLADAELSITISAFVDTNKVTFRIGDSERRHTCQEVNAETLMPVIQEAISRSQGFLEAGLDRFLDQVREAQRSPRRIGFDTKTP